MFIVNCQQLTEKGGERVENIDIRLLVADSGLTYKAIAEELGIHRGSLSRLMRKQLSPKNRVRILTAIDRLKAREAKESDV